MSHILDMIGSDVGPLAAWWAEALLRASVQGGAAAVVLHGVLRALPRIAPAAQAWLWRLVMVKFLAAVVLPIPVAWGGAGAVPGLAGGAEGGALLPLIILAASAAGASVWAGGLVSEAAVLRRLRRWAQPCADEAVLGVLAALAARLRTGVPALLISAGVERPVLVGALRPAILLPRRFTAGCAAEDLRLILAHELAHVRRRDLAWNWLPCVVHGFFFFHPLMWLAQRELRLAQDAACDAAALRTTRASPAAYGRLLMGISQLPQPPQRALWAAASAVEDFRSLRRRLSLLGSRSASILSPATVAAALIALVMAPSWHVQLARVPPLSPDETLIEPPAESQADAAALPPARMARPAASPAAPRRAMAAPAEKTQHIPAGPRSSAAR